MRTLLAALSVPLLQRTCPPSFHIPAYPRSRYGQSGVAAAKRAARKARRKGK